jgi:hypothetical protein
MVLIQIRENQFGLFRLVIQQYVKVVQSTEVCPKDIDVFEVRRSRCRMCQHSKSIQFDGETVLERTVFEENIACLERVMSGWK